MTWMDPDTFLEVGLQKMEDKWKFMSKEMGICVCGRGGAVGDSEVKGAKHKLYF